MGGDGVKDGLLSIGGGFKCEFVFVDEVSGDTCDTRGVVGWISNADDGTNGTNVGSGSSELGTFAVVVER